MVFNRHPQYIFDKDREGKLRFIGDFDGLYLADVDPWGQSGDTGTFSALYHARSRNAIAAALVPRIHSGPLPMRALEVGCGHGHALKHFANCFPHVNWCGMEISRVAIDQAKVLNPSLTIFQGDITKSGEYLGTSGYSIILLNQVLWYILERLPEAIWNCVSMLNPGGYLVVSQGFLGDRQAYGVDIIDGFNSMVRAFMRHPKLEIVQASYEDWLVSASSLHDGLAVFRSAISGPLC